MVRVIFLCILFVINFSAIGQIQNVYNRISTTEGLNTNKVNCIYQDKKGFFWIGTQNGIQRFDGRKFINFRSNGLTKSLPPYSIDQILDAGNNKMWIRQGSIVGLFNPITFEYSNIPIEDYHKYSSSGNIKLVRDSRDNTFLCLEKYELLWYDQENNKFTKNNLPIKVPDGWPVSDLYEDTLRDDYWICSAKGLAVYNHKNKSINYHNHNQEKIAFFENQNLLFVYNFYIDKSNTWWIFYWDYNPLDERAKIIHYDPKKNQVIPDTIDLKSHLPAYYELSWVFETKKGNIWSGGLNSLLKYESESKALVQYKKSTPSDFDINCRKINQMYQDREGNIWICTDNGIYIFSEDNAIFNYTFDKSELNNNLTVTSLLETKNSKNWIGTWGNGIFLLDNHIKEIKNNLYESIPIQKHKQYSQIWDLCQHEESGLIWAGCQGGFLMIFNPDTNKPLELLNLPIFENSTIRQVLEDKDGNLLFGTQSGRLIKWTKGSKIINESFEIIHEFNTSIFVLYKDNANRIWIGTHKAGVYLMDPIGKNVISHFMEKPYTDLPPIGLGIADIEQYNDSIYFVSNGFLNIINSNTGDFKTLTQLDGLAGAEVSRMLLDNNEILWFTHNNGIGSYNHEKKVFASYNERNGVIFGNKSIFSKLKKRNGELWFAGENILYKFNPFQLNVDNVPNEVTLTDFKIFNKFIPLDSLLSLDKVKLKPEQNSFTIYFSSLSYTQQYNLVYYYKLEGVDNEWVKAGRELAANYTVLPPGNYNFKVKCVNQQSDKSTGITSLSLSILPHYYQTWWFTILVLLAVSILIYFIYHQRINKLLAVERIRTKVARDLHDDIGSTLSTINILSSMAKSKMITDPVKTSSYISKITDNSQQMMEAMDDIVWSIKPDNDSMLKIVARMREHVSGILEPKDIEINFNIEERVLDIRLNMEARRDVFLIFKEAVNNIAKYSSCSKADIELKYKNHKLIMIVKDNGRGFEVLEADGGNGLGNMKKRAESLQGIIEIKSQQGFGTEVILNIPVNT